MRKSNFANPLWQLWEASVAADANTPAILRARNAAMDTMALQLVSNGMKSTAAIRAVEDLVAFAEDAIAGQREAAREEAGRV